MCGDSSPRDSLGGALAVLSPLQFSAGASALPLSGRLVFYNGKTASAMATHAIFTPDSSLERDPMKTEPCVLRVHETGDLRTPLAESPSLTTSMLKPVAGIIGNSLEFELERPLTIGFGNDGIIGRKVSIWTQHGAGPLAEGIIGYN
ncbi:hypothetical protein F4802DRAFT_88813 [Xylaria palmicola]|nr:hypothetical protein F4802DRAFT_88813 [Xylaria palmicola]